MYMYAFEIYPYIHVEAIFSKRRTLLHGTRSVHGRM